MALELPRYVNVLKLKALLSSHSSQNRAKSWSILPYVLRSRFLHVVIWQLVWNWLLFVHGGVSHGLTDYCIPMLTFEVSGVLTWCSTAHLLISSKFLHLCLVLKSGNAVGLSWSNQT